MAITTVLILFLMPPRPPSKVWGLLSLRVRMKTPVNREYRTWTLVLETHKSHLIQGGKSGRRLALNWVAVKELKLSYHNGYL